MASRSLGFLVPGLVLAVFFHPGVDGVPRLFRGSSRDAPRFFSRGGDSLQGHLQNGLRECLKLGSRKNMATVRAGYFDHGIR